MANLQQSVWNNALMLNDPEFQGQIEEAIKEIKEKVLNFN